jgi:hypothetical protein
MDTVYLMIGAAFFFVVWRLVYVIGRLDGGKTT